MTRRPFAHLNVLEQLGLLFLLMDHTHTSPLALEDIDMPPYKAVTSKAQSRKLFALANRGELSMDEAKGKTRAANFKSLPERKGKGRKSRKSRR